jgi:hypothetical protein
LHRTGKVLYYNPLPALTSSHIGNILLLLKYFGCTTSQRGIPFGYFLHLLVQGHQGPLVFSGIFIAKEVDGVQAKGSGDITTVFIHTLRDLLEYIIDICQSN